MSAAQHRNTTVVPDERANRRRCGIRAPRTGIAT